MGLLPDHEIAGIVATLHETANARLTKITEPGTVDRNGDPGPGTDLWTGSAPCWLERERHDELSGGTQVPVHRDSLVVLDADAPPAMLAAGPDWDAVTVTVQDLRVPGSPVTITWTVKAAEHTAFGLVDSVRLELEGEQAA